MPRLNASSQVSRGRDCLECGAAYQTDKQTSQFCSAACRRAYNNRRQTRGAELYDLFMAHRFDRSAARALRVLSMLNRLASMYREEDRRERGSRRSWTPPEVVAERAPHLRAIVLLKRGAR
ncbi:hypothetical protein [Lichenifustis flavocetrariae]|uniref:Uncharacterized protein n=1 Tax=Lichenifustis flavocetrariae TaxID=2949735 RepID=A0AA42CJQ4_9HYPH|nr:hypothetical protein [Lichenifustis flavocetrariae]MCW6509798.1 hypothetical protein [Lichenifustis flavocetrariae]